MMTVFQTAGASRYAFRAVFDDRRFANVSFFDKAGSDIPFHISLRADDNLISLNCRTPRGWRREHHYRVAFQPGGTDVELIFQNGNVRILLDGTPLKLGLWSRQRFRKLDNIAFVDHQGALIGVLTDADCRRPGEPADQPLTLSRRLELRGCLPPGSDAPDLQVSGQDAPLPVAMRTGTDGRRHAMTVLPGRVWQGGAEALDLTMQSPAGTALASTRITRADLLDCVRAILAPGDLRGDSYVTALVAEHVKHAGLHPDLSAAEMATLTSAARKHGLADYLGTGPATSPAPATPPADQAAATPAPDPAHDALAQVTHALSAGQTLRQALTALPALTAEDGRRVLLALLEPACVRGDVRDLIDWGDTQALGAFDLGDDIWRNTAILPILFCTGRVPELVEVLKSVKTPPGCWVVTPAIGWVAAEALYAPHLRPAQRDEIIAGVTDFMAGQGHGYWERSACAALTDAAAAMVAAMDHLPAALNRRITRALLSTYATEPAFWDAVQTRAARLPTELQTARTAFDRIQAALAAPDDPQTAQQAHQALTWLERKNSATATRIRRELFGPGGLPGSLDQLPDPGDLTLTHPNPPEAALRMAAHPGAGPLPAPMAELCADAMAAFYPEVPQDRFAQIQARAITGALAELRGQPADDLEADLAALSQASAGFSGLAIAIGLLTAQVESDQQDAAFARVQQLVLALPEAQKSQLLQAPALIAALDRLRSDAPLYARVAALLPAPPEDAKAAPLPASPLPASPLFNTIVTVFSCRPNLTTRIPPMRAGWLADLKALGVPYVVIVGGPGGPEGTGHLDGDVLEVPAPDDYEGLPQKTLATIRWVHEQTGYGHMLKIDDDCYLNAPVFFGDYSYRKADYHGRRLTRGPGQMDRAWHVEKSSSLRGRTELDKSPEPSTYADGGSGYALSRRAMGAVLRAAQSPRGQFLEQVSFMEDKLLGDLLTLEGVDLDSTGYHVAIRRRMAADRAPVSRWVNGFFASAAAPVKLVHLDTHIDQLEATLLQDQPELRPSKIWPSYQPVRLGYQSNTLELISPPARIDAARQAPVSVVACLRNEIFMLPQFLTHYRSLGVESFLIADNCSDDGTTEYLADQPDVALFSVDTDYNLSRYGVAWQQALMSNFRVGKWSLVADADELLVWQTPQTQSLADLLNGPDFAQADAARVFMLDMYPQGALADVSFASGDPFAETGFVDRTPFLANWPGLGPYSNARTWTSALRHRLIPGTRPDLFVAQKLALLRYHPGMRFSDGLHYGAGMRVAERELLFGHFKYNADFHRKVQDEVARGQHFNDAEEYRKYLARMSEGRDVIYDPAVSVRWTDSPFVQDRLNPTD